MLPTKTIPTVGSGRNRSFGGHNKPKSGTPSHIPTAAVHSGQSGGGDLSSLTSDTANLLLHGEEFPALGRVDTCPSPPASHSAHPEGALSSRGAFQAKNMLSTSWKSLASSTSSKPSTSSKQIHHGARQEDDWADEEDRLQHKVNKKKGSIRKHASAVAEDENGTPICQDRIYFLGRLLTAILRHKASYLKLQMRNDGYVAVDDLLKLNIQTKQGIPLRAYTVDDILKAVKQDSKQRLNLLTEDDALLIRANQGHSIKTIDSDKLLEPILSADEIPVCVHGTLKSNLTLITKFGLKKMGRNHVHFASGLPRENGVISGMRHTSEVLIYLDVKKALQDGMKLYKSANGVILTEGYDGVVPPEYFERIATWDDGKMTPLPWGTKARV